MFNKTTSSPAQATVRSHLIHRKYSSTWNSYWTQTGSKTRARNWAHVLHNQQVLNQVGLFFRPTFWAQKLYQNGTRIETNPYKTNGLPLDICVRNRGTSWHNSELAHPCFPEVVNPSKPSAGFRRKPKKICLHFCTTTLKRPAALEFL